MLKTYRFTEDFEWNGKIIPKGTLVALGATIKLHLNMIDYETREFLSISINPEIEFPYGEWEHVLEELSDWQLKQ